MQEEVVYEYKVWKIFFQAFYTSDNIVAVKLKSYKSTSTRNNWTGAPEDNWKDETIHFQLSSVPSAQ